MKHTFVRWSLLPTGGQKEVSIMGIFSNLFKKKENVKPTISVNISVNTNDPEVAIEDLKESYRQRNEG